MKHKWLWFPFLFCLALLLFSGGKLWALSRQQAQSEAAFSALRQQRVRPPLPPLAPVGSAQPPPSSAPATPQEVYGPLAAQNPDMVGWLTIAGTTVDYPVMQTDSDYYLDHGFDGAPNPYGVPFVPAQCTLSDPTVPVLIYGHNTKVGELFGPLEGYEDAAFRAAHATLQFDRLTSFGTYQLVAVVKTTATASDPAAFDFTVCGSIRTQAAFDEFWASCLRCAIYQADIPVQYGDSLLLLSTCTYSQENGRLLVVAKQKSL